MKIKMLLLILLSATILLSLVGTAQAVTKIKECTDITESGDYVLTKNLKDVAGNCIQIYADDVTLSCKVSQKGNGIRTIDGTGTGYGIYIYNNDINGNDNVVVKNCKITDFKYGIKTQYGNDFEFSDITLNSNKYGMFIHTTSFMTITDVSADENDYGIMVGGFGSQYNTLTRVTANSNIYDGIHMGSQYTTVTSTDFIDVEASQNGGDGIHFGQAPTKDNTFTRVTANENTYGIYLDSIVYGRYHLSEHIDYVFDDVTASNNVKSGIYSNGVFKNAEFIDVTTIDNGEYGIYSWGWL